MCGSVSVSCSGNEPQRGEADGRATGKGRDFSVRSRRRGGHGGAALVFRDLVEELRLAGRPAYPRSERVDRTLKRSCSRISLVRLSVVAGVSSNSPDLDRVLVRPAGNTMVFDLAVRISKIPALKKRLCICPVNWRPARCDCGRLL
jgi:hypothetical protein